VEEYKEDEGADVDWAHAFEMLRAKSPSNRLRPRSKFATTMLSGRTGYIGNGRHKRFCADCGFARQTLGRGYAPSMRVKANGTWVVWGIRGREVTKEDEVLGDTCRIVCKTYYGSGGRCDHREHYVPLMDGPQY
jgi:hypothetical protein